MDNYMDIWMDGYMDTWMDGYMDIPRIAFIILRIVLSIVVLIVVLHAEQNNLFATPLAILRLDCSWA